MTSYSTEVGNNNYPVMALVILSALGLSIIAAHAVQTAWGIAGYTWLAVAFIWGVVNYIISYNECRFLDLGNMVSFFQAATEFLLLMTLLTIIEFYLSYDLYYGISLLAVFTLAKMYYSVHPWFVTRKTYELPEVGEEEFVDREAGLQWGQEEKISASISREEALKRAKSIDAEEDDFAVLKKNASTARIKTGDGSSHLSAVRTNEKIGLSLGDEERKRYLEAFGLIRFETEKTITLEEAVRMIEMNITPNRHEVYTIPDSLSKSGLKLIPKSTPKNKGIINISNIERVKLLILALKYDMSNMFNMKFRLPLEFDVEFVEEKEFGDAVQMVEKIKEDGTWLLSVPGGLDEDETCIFTTAELTDMWLQETTGREKNDFAKGFSYWVSDKICKKRGYSGASDILPKELEEELLRINFLEECVGEYGVIFRMLHKKYPDYIDRMYARKIEDMLRSDEVMNLSIMSGQNQWDLETLERELKEQAKSNEQ